MVRALQEELSETRPRRSHTQESMALQHAQGSKDLPRSPAHRRSSRANPMDRLMQTCSSLASSMETSSRYEERRRPQDPMRSSRYREEHYGAPSTPSRSSQGEPQDHSTIVGPQMSTAWRHVGAACIHLSECCYGAGVGRSMLICVLLICLGFIPRCKG